jgi:hypothetical protein
VGTIGGYPTTDISRELLLRPILKTRAASRLASFVYSGLDVTPISGLNVSISSGYACITGLIVFIDAAVTLTMAANQLSYLWLQFTEDGGGLVTGVQWVSTTAGAVPSGASSVLVGLVSMGASAPSGLTPIQSSQKSPGTNSFDYTGDSRNDRLIFCGACPREVTISWQTGVSPIIYRYSQGIGGSGTIPGLYVASTPSATVSVSRDYRPDIGANEFYVSAAGLNVNGVTYHVVVFF